MGCTITYIIKGISTLKTKLETQIKEAAINVDIFNIKPKNNKSKKKDDIIINNNNNNKIISNRKQRIKLNKLFPPKKNSSFIGPNYTNILNNDAHIIDKNNNNSKNNMNIINKKQNRKENKAIGKIKLKKFQKEVLE